MAKKINGNLEARLLDARLRMKSGLSDGALFETTNRVRALQNSLEDLGEKQALELYRHFPVAAISVLETHFRSSIASIVNFNPMYLERGLILSSDALKSSVELLSILHRKTITIGELIAYSMPFNSVASLEKVFDTLFNDDFKKLMSSALDPYFVRNKVGNGSPVIDDIKSLWRDLSVAFEQRHILAHEAASNFIVSYKDAKSALDSIVAFTNAFDAVKWATVWKDLPLTQYEMNNHAWDNYKKSRIKFSKELKRCLNLATKNGMRQRFRKQHAEWKIYSNNLIAWECENFTMGSIGPLIEAMARMRAIDSQLESISAIFPEEFKIS